MKIAPWQSLLVVLGLLAVSIIASLVAAKKDDAEGVAHGTDPVRGPGGTRPELEGSTPKLVEGDRSESK